MTREPVELRCVSEENNNKFYRLADNNDGTLTATWGRIGVFERSKSYPIDAWDSIIHEKTRPKTNKQHYQDVTHLLAHAIEDNGVEIDTGDPTAKALINRLRQFAKKKIATTYNVTAAQLDQAAVKEAQDIIDEISTLTTAGRLSVTQANSLLLALYTVIPRRMKYVPDHLVQDFTHLQKGQKLDRIITREQDNIDTMAQQVEEHESGSGESESLEAAGIKLEGVTTQEFEEVLKLAGPHHDRVDQVYRVINCKTQERYNEFLQSVPEERQVFETLWHGSRNQNWLWIVHKGLLIRPSGVVTTGNAFGNGIYFARELIKSLGYTSLKDAYWADENEDVGYCAVYNVHVGIPLVLEWGDGSLSLEEITKRGKDSTLGRKGARLVRDEIIIYRPAQCTIKWIVQIK